LASHATLTASAMLMSTAARRRAPSLMSMPRRVTWSRRAACTGAKPTPAENSAVSVWACVRTALTFEPIAFTWLNSGGVRRGGQGEGTVRAELPL
jgi:hypothetical protein